MHTYRARGAVVAWELTNTSAPAPSVAAMWRVLSRHGSRVLHWWADQSGSVSITGAGGIASGEAFGTAAVSTGSAANFSGAGGIASGEAFGSAVVSTNLVSNVSGAGGIASGEAFGSPAVSPTFEVAGQLTRSRWRVGRRSIPGNPG
jgi:hypothetical protein